MEWHPKTFISRCVYVVFCLWWKHGACVKLLISIDGRLETLAGAVYHEKWHTKSLYNTACRTLTTVFAVWPNIDGHQDMFDLNTMSGLTRLSAGPHNV